MPQSSYNKININKVWKSNKSGRSIFGWKIKEEIFAIFFILVILALAGDEKIVEKVNNNTYIQIFVAIAVLYCIYNKIPWSLAFILIFLIAILFSGFVSKIKETVSKTFLDLKSNNIEYEDIDVSVNQEAMVQIMQKSGQMGVPQTEIDGKVIVGFDKEAVDKALGLSS